MSDNVKFVITNENWDDNFDDVRSAFTRKKTLITCYYKKIVTCMSWL